MDWEPDRYVYVQIADVIQKQIESGELPPKSALRGERDMAEEFQVAILTVRRAVKELRDRGLVDTLPGKGTFVARELPGQG